MWHRAALELGEVAVLGLQVTLTHSLDAGEPAVSGVSYAACCYMVGLLFLRVAKLACFLLFFLTRC